MNDSSSDNGSIEWGSGFESRDTVIVISDCPGDTTVRPVRPELLRFAQAEREKIERYGGLTNQPPPSAEPPNSPDKEDGKQ